MYMDRVYSKELANVEDYLKSSDRKNKLIELQKKVTNEIKTALEKPELVKSFDRVFSREDVDAKNKIKTARKVALKLHSWNRGKTDDLAKPQDVHDIAGVTIVCTYPSETDKIVDYLSNKFESNYFSFTPFAFKDPQEFAGYRAYHGIINGRGKFRGLSCEVQVKTQLTLSWGGKTHDLTYKPIGDIDIRLQKYMVQLSTIVQMLDEQSEILKSLISEAWELDATRRDVARMHMIERFLQKENPKIMGILKFIKLNQEELSIRDLNFGVASEADDMIHAYIETCGYNIDICRLACIFALGRTFNDLNEWCLDIMDEWVAASKGDEEYHSAIVFRSLACMAMGEYEEAIENGRKVLLASQETGDDKFITLAQSNLAYFLSEAYYHRAFDESIGHGQLEKSVTDECSLEALDLIDKLESNGVENLSLTAQDTIGNVLITCGKSEDDIRRGLSICYEAREKAQDNDNLSDAMNAFFDLHEKRAFRRILSL